MRGESGVVEGRRGLGRRGEGGEGGEGVGVDCGNEAEVVLVFLEVGVCCCGCLVEGVEEGRVEGAEGEFVDVVGEVEGYCFLPVSSRL